MNGYVKCHRKIEDNPVVCKDNDYFRVWHHLLYNASHKERLVDFNGEPILLKPGQLITGRLAIANKCKVSESKVERILKRFKIEHQIEQQSCNKGRLITLINWVKYQPENTENEQQLIPLNLPENLQKNTISGQELNNKQTKSEQHSKEKAYNDKTNSEQQIEQQLNNNWTTTKQQVNTNNKDNNVNNEINSILTTTYSTDETIFDFIQKQFGRSMYPAEYEVVEKWDDNELTRYAIKQAVLNGAFNVNYIEKILFTYKQLNIKTITQAIEREKKFKTKNIKLNNNPRWMSESINEVQISDEEEKEMKSLLKEFRE